MNDELKRIDWTKPIETCTGIKADLKAAEKDVEDFKKAVAEFGVAKN